MAKESYRIKDEFGQTWIIDEFDELYEQAKMAVEGQRPNIPVWPLRSIMEKKGWGWWTVWASMEEVISGLKKIMPDPMDAPLLLKGQEYSIQDMKSKLMEYGGYIAYLSSFLGRLKGQSHSLKKGYEGAILVGSDGLENVAKGASEKSKEATLLAGSELLRQTKRLDVTQASLVELIQGWCNAYESAYNAVSRVVELQKVESDHD